MLRFASSSIARPAVAHRRRNLVSTVLLNRDWQTESVADLKQELRKRGLSQKGNKATLITRILEHEQQRSIEHVSPSPAAPAGQVRKASSTNVPGLPESAQPPPPPLPQDFIAVKLPDLSGPDPEPPVQIPSTPDFWESSLEKTPHAAVAEPVEPAPPKLHVVAGSATHHGGGPSAQVHDSEEVPPPPAPEPAQPTTALGSLFRDVAEDLGLPTQSARKVVESAQEQFLGTPESTETSGDVKSYERKLDSKEKRGVLVLVGLLVGGWLAGGLNS
ncbi:hypothetical protein GLOTRDRAFT_109995 [Gloeophyllum trabeum ATCC 11539]|uniref:SAP domain-containing protein n=1 Tax=Gloeophyllum trabeum (strain ATCC 11539 / FP-39264 / Madison 617) TaxID=670483 RepID=S7QF74_GLOTA|nr:uncharacterized protein GLOTRDRAFT_109995 [Gloeophyllum trabeum ATCC 11539]EPQ58017.1 hypothetical protein GLOTRDRAFT_109995 [Gloeophyllum trabeum ATCC 11539]